MPYRLPDFAKVADYTAQLAIRLGIAWAVARYLPLLWEGSQLEAGVNRY